MNHIQCTGWWEQAGYGRQTMDGLLIVIDDNKVTGSGIDMVGPFTLSGSLDADAGVHLVKDYMGQHRVDYIGHYDGETRLWGHWQISRLRGSWEIRIKSPGTQETQQKEKTETVSVETALPDVSA